MRSLSELLARATPSRRSPARRRRARRRPACCCAASARATRVLDAVCASIVRRRAGSGLAFTAMSAGGGRASRGPCAAASIGLLSPSRAASAISSRAGSASAYVGDDFRIARSRRARCARARRSHARGIRCLSSTSTAARAKLETAPLVKQASVRKLYPEPDRHRHRRANARGALAARRRSQHHRRRRRRASTSFATRGSTICRLWSAKAPTSGSREFLALLDAAQELRAEDRRRRLGRRTALEPQDEVRRRREAAGDRSALGGARRCSSCERQSRILERDILWLDLRTPGRVFARLSADAAAARAQKLATRKPRRATTP